MGRCFQHILYRAQITILLCIYTAPNTMVWVNHQISVKTTPQKHFTYATAKLIPSPLWLFLEPPGCPSTTPEVTNAHCFLPDKKVSALWKKPALGFEQSISALTRLLVLDQKGKCQICSLQIWSRPYRGAWLPEETSSLPHKTLEKTDTVTCPRRQKHYPLQQLINIWKKAFIQTQWGAHSVTQRIADINSNIACLDPSQSAKM